MIEQVGRELMQPNEQGLEQVEGHRIVELLQATPLEPLAEDEGAASNGTGPPQPRVAKQVCTCHLSNAACSLLPSHRQDTPDGEILWNLAGVPMLDMRRRASWKTLVSSLSELCAVAVAYHQRPVLLYRPRSLAAQPSQQAWVAAAWHASACQQGRSPA